MFTVQRQALEIIASWLLAAPVPASSRPAEANAVGRELVALALSMQLQQKMALLGRAALHGVRAHAALSVQRRERLGMLRSEARCPSALWWRLACERETTRRQLIEDTLTRPQRTLVNIAEQLSYVGGLTAEAGVYFQVNELCGNYERCRRALDRFKRLHPEYVEELGELEDSEDGEDTVSENF
jgi:hypothetical protein